jgi:AcrR family transcriptional regulator
MSKPLKTKGKATPKVARKNASGLSILEIATELGVSRESVRRKLTAAGINPTTATLRWRDVVKVFTATGDWRAERARLTKAQADMAEHEVRLATREVINLEEVADYIRRTFVPVRQWAHDMPAKLASRVNPTDPKHAMIHLDEWVEQFLKHCREYVPPGQNDDETTNAKGTK